MNTLLSPFQEFWKKGDKLLLLLCLLASVYGVALIFSTHDPQLARDYADEILKLEGGTLHAVAESRV